jgi:amidase
MLRAVSHEMLYTDQEQNRTFHLDGGDDVRGQLSLSGEELLPECFLQQTSPSSAKEIASLNVEKRRYQKRYLDYWNSTSQISGTGRPVEAIICPVAPSAAVRPGHFKYSGFTSFVNVLDYSSISIPVTCFDSQLQKDDGPITYLSSTDEAVHASCEFILP